jgi:FeS assembly SUF system protein
MTSSTPLPGSELEELVLRGPGWAPTAEPVPPEELRPKLVQALRSVYDPEIPVSIYDLGLIYRLEVDARGAVSVDLTLTAPGCPVADMVLEEAHSKLQAVPGVASVQTRLVWDPPWDPELLSDAVRLELGL